MGSLRKLKGKLEQKSLPRPLISELRTFLGKDGVEFFQQCKDTYGTVSPVYFDAGRIPHPVHFREGMTVRNFMRRTIYCQDWDDNDFDGLWAKAVEEALVIID